MLAVDVYLANKPTGAPLVFLIIAIVLFAIAALVSFAGPRVTTVHNLAGLLLSAGLAFFVLAFLVSK